jgi:hypothetical protein
VFQRDCRRARRAGLRRARVGRGGPALGLYGLKRGRRAASSSASRAGRDRRRQRQKVERSILALAYWHLGDLKPGPAAAGGGGERLGRDVIEIRDVLVKTKSKNQKIKKEEDVNVVSAPSPLSFDSCQQWIVSLPKFIYGRIIYQVLLTFHVFHQ